MKERTSPKRLLIDVPEDYHQKIKMMAIKRKMTIREYLIRIINEQIIIEDRYK